MWVTSLVWYKKTRINKTIELIKNLWVWNLDSRLLFAASCSAVVAEQCCYFSLELTLVQCESKKSPLPPEDWWQFFQNSWEFFNQILHAYYAFLSTLDYKCLFNYLQLWRSYAIFSVTTQFTSCAQDVHHRLKRRLAFSDIFPKQLEIFGPNFTHLLHVPIYARLQFFYPIIFNCDEFMPHQVRPPSVRFNRWWTFWAYNGGRT